MSYNRRRMMAMAAVRDAQKARHEADRLAIIAWNLRAWAEGVTRPSPTLKQARTHGYTDLRFECGGCRRSWSVPLQAIAAAPDVALWTLEPQLACDECRTQHGRPARSRLRELCGGPDSR